MIHIPENIRSLQTYKPGKASDAVLQQQPIVLCSNENNFGPSPMAVEAIKEASERIFLYPDPTAQQLRTKLAQHLGIQADQLVFGNGSDAILSTLFNAFFSAGESILTSSGSFVSLYPMAQMNRVPVHKVPLTEEYGFDLHKLLLNIRPHTKAIYLCNPNNPTGAMIPQEELEQFLDQVPEHILVIVDEAYFEFAEYMSAAYPDSTRLGYENVISLRTFSKAYGLAGVRLGYAIGPVPLIEALTKVKLTFNPNLLAQAAGVAALQDEAHVQKTLSNNAIWLDRFSQTFRQMGIRYAPSYANFLMLDLESEEKATEFCQHLQAKGILVRHLASFGLPHCVRVSVGRPAENERMLEVVQARFGLLRQEH
ncbi:MAG: histidinol-phosphate transaminase [Bacteroidota bacterium]